LKKNDTAALQAAVVVTGTASTDVSWSTSNSAIVEITAQIAASCTIKANTSGTAVITAASTFDGTKTAQYTVKAFEENAANAMAEGGTITIIKNAAGDAYEEIHAFKTTGSANFKWKDGVTPAASGALLVVGAGGGGGGGTIGGFYAKGGNGGRVIYNAAFALPSGSTTVTVGAGGTAGTSSSTYGGTGGSSAFGTMVTAAGGTGGAGQQGSTATGNVGMGSGSYTIEANTAKAYGAAGPSKSDAVGNGAAGAANTGAGGQAGYGFSGGAGGSGIVVVRFRYQ
jgi:hypothetical protein